MLPCFADKSNIRHPYQDPDAGHPQLLWRSEEPFERRHGKAVKEGGFMDAVPGAVELTVEAGDALLLVESCVHGSGIRTLPGCRKTILLRYGPDPKSGWKAKPEVFDRLSPAARALIYPEPEEPPEPELDAEGKVKLNHHVRLFCCALSSLCMQLCNLCAWVAGLIGFGGGRATRSRRCPRATR